MEQKQKTIYDLELHQSMQILTDTHVMRCHGGFIYTTIITDTEKGTFLNSNQIFVPYEEPVNITVGELPPFDELMLFAKKQSNEKETD